MSLTYALNSAARNLGFQLPSISPPEPGQRIRSALELAERSERHAALVGLLIDHPYTPEVVEAILDSDLLAGRPVERALLAWDALNLIIFPPNHAGLVEKLRASARYITPILPQPGESVLRVNGSTLYGFLWHEMSDRFAADDLPGSAGAKQRTLREDCLSNADRDALGLAATELADIEAALILAEYDGSAADPTLRADSCAAILNRADALLTAGLPTSASYLLLLLSEIEADDEARSMLAELHLEQQRPDLARSALEQIELDNEVLSPDVRLAAPARLALAEGDLERAGEILNAIDDPGEALGEFARRNPLLVTTAVEYSIATENDHPLCDGLSEVLAADPSQRQANRVRSWIEFGILTASALGDSALLVFKQALIDFPGYAPLWDLFFESVADQQIARTTVDSVLAAVITYHPHALPIWRRMSAYGGLPGEVRAAIGAQLERVAKRQKVQ